MEKKKTALITGATAGIGAATAHRLASEGWRLILTGRRQERLEELSAELKAAYQTELLLLCFDVRSEEETTKALGNLPEEWAAIDVLVNNAGLASGLEPIQDGDTTDWNKMIDTNIKGLLYVTKTIAPRMMEARKGHIINLGSMAGRQVYPNGAVYCATKHAVDALSQGMRLDLLPYGIKVSQVMPGAVETRLYKK